MTSTSTVSPSVERTVPSYTQYQEILARIPAPNGYSRRLTEVHELHQCALGYAWGWHDANGPQARDSGDAGDFARAYAYYAAQYACGDRFSRRPIQDAWQAWLKFGDVTAPLY